MNSDFSLCVLVPTYNNPQTLRAVVLKAREFVESVVVIDDGSDLQSRAIVEQIGKEGLAHVHHREKNGGKGAAVKTGFDVATNLGFTHALQVDADGQHDLARIGDFVAAAQARPDALILASPLFAKGTPCGRRWARKITIFFVHIETLGPVIDDAMIGFRVYPIARALACRARGDRMDFDIEIAVRMVWHGVPVHNIPIAVRYLTTEQGGISHFRLFDDNARISWAHTRLVSEGLLRGLFTRKPFGRRQLGAI